MIEQRRLRRERSLVDAHEPAQEHSSFLPRSIESFVIDLRRSLATYHLEGGTTLEVNLQPIETQVAADLDSEALQNLIDEIHLEPGRKNQRFWLMAARAGCARYYVSFPRRCVLYFGRHGETHEELLSL